MNKSFIALATLAVTAGVAQAQSAVTVYGNIDLGVFKKTGATLSEGRRDNNRLGFKGVEDLGDGLKALFQMEIRYDPDVGTIEGTTRPLFQGQSRVGLQGSFGTLRVGRGLTALQDSNVAFEPFRGTPSTAGFITDLMVAGYTSQPLDPAGSSANRFSNAVFYNSPEVAGLQLNVTVATREANGNPALIGRGTAAAPQYAANAALTSNPYSVSATYRAGILGAMLATERNAAETRLWSVAGSVQARPDLKLVASYQSQDQEHTVAVNPVTKAWVVGANLDIGPGTLLAGYGRKTPDGAVPTKQIGLGYEYYLSKRTFLYTDVSNRKAATSVNFYGVGIHHKF
ncbi:porin [Duganella sp. BJB488]|uniref:porin n=1 Tax=unclassified Duganella TaxID=2636909 RepID=UPI000E3418B4|nr:MULTISPECIES: porin [unclassified Duganella]RFP13273.1 porin [Duganella sp. BJB489]RFP17151.1 porin [Duganella sp. BJB488]RFP31630.1 porin [Duganella sp. BJB480]